MRTGPIFKLIEEKLFALEWFIKHTPTNERVTEILRELNQLGAKIVSTDYTSFEALFTKEFMDATELELYRYMTQNLPDQEWIDIVTEALTGINSCDFANFSIDIEATRMSGEMCTSLGNSFANLMAFLFICEEAKCESVKGRVEGDDGIFTYFGRTLTSKDFEELGLIIKIQEHDVVTEASFCGIIADADELINIRNPIEALLDFGWTTQQYEHSNLRTRMGLLRAKALSMKYQYNGCPVLEYAARYALRMTEGFEPKWNSYLSTYELQRKKINEVDGKYPIKDPGIKTRLLAEKMFNLSVETQKVIETYFEKCDRLQPIDLRVIDELVNKDQKHYYDNYVCNVGLDTSSSLVNYRRTDYCGAINLYE